MFSLVFACFDFTEIWCFLNFPSQENVRKQHLSANAYSCGKIKFWYTIAVRKDETLWKCHIITKTSNFSLVFRSTFRWRYLSQKMKFSTFYFRENKHLHFIEDVFMFPLISWRKRGQRTEDLKNFGTEYNWFTWSVTF